MANTTNNLPSGCITNTSCCSGNNCAVIKICSSSRNSSYISNRKVTITSRDCGITMSGKTNNNGCVTFCNLPCGQYLARLSGKDNQNSATVKFIITGNTCYTCVYFYSGSTKCSNKIGVKLVAETYDGVPLADGEFELYNSNDTLIRKFTTDSNGEVFFTNLLMGSYTVKQTVAPNGYCKSKMDYEVTLSRDAKCIKFTVVNKKKLKKGLVYLKLNNTQNYYDVSKHFFKLTTNEGILVAKGITNSEGCLKFNNVPLNTILKIKQTNKSGVVCKGFSDTYVYLTNTCFIKQVCICINKK